MNLHRILLQHPVFTVLYEIGILLTCIAGDGILMRVKGTDDPLFFQSVASDEVAHAMVGFFAWGIADNLVSFDLSKLVRCTLCAFLAIAIDVDHLIAAGSLNLKAAVSLSHRPFLHATSLVLLLGGVLWMLGWMRGSRILKLLTLLLMTAWLTHHLRDGFRRGLWLPPLGSTPPVPYWLYLVGTMAIPLVTRVLLQKFAAPELITLDLEKEVPVPMEILTQ